MIPRTHCITVGRNRYHLNSKMEQWCHDNVGAGGWGTDSVDWDNGRKWAMSSMFGNTTFIFKEPKYLTLFLLRWSG